MKRIAGFSFFFLVLLMVLSVPVASGQVQTYIVQVGSAEIAAAVVTEHGGQVNRHYR